MLLTDTNKWVRCEEGSHDRTRKKSTWNELSELPIVVHLHTDNVLSLELKIVRRIMSVCLSACLSLSLSLSLSLCMCVCVYVYVSISQLWKGNTSVEKVMKTPVFRSHQWLTKLFPVRTDSLSTFALAVWIWPSIVALSTLYTGIWKLEWNLVCITL